MISNELAAGICRRQREVERLTHQLGGIGARVRGAGPDGAEHRGTLVAATATDVDPYVQTADGRRWRCRALRHDTE